MTKMPLGSKQGLTCRGTGWLPAHLEEQPHEKGSAPGALAASG